MSVKILIGDVCDLLKAMPSDSIDCVVTSPPYWGLRDYGVAGQLGMERTLGEHVAVMVEVFREVRRVLKLTGTLWLNYGDSYAATPNGRSAADTKAAGNDDRTFRDKPFSTVGPVYDPEHRPAGTNRSRGLNTGSKQVSNGAVPLGRIVAGGYLKPKDLCGIPWRVALALQEDGWWLRQDIIWAKPNPMPESVSDRCTKAHEYLFLLTKSEHYYFDAEAIEEPANRPEGAGNVSHKGKTAYENGDRRMRTKVGLTEIGPRETRNKRSVWWIATEPFPEAHFATFPTELVKPCILAGCPEDGLVLDPFGGAGTTGLVADRLKRNAILLELNPEFAAMAKRRIFGETPLFTDVS